jgi:hypothetical protein
MDAAIGTHAVDRDDVRVLQLRGGLGLDAKSLALTAIDRRGER